MDVCLRLYGACVVLCLCMYEVMCVSVFAELTAAIHSVGTIF